MPATSATVMPFHSAVASTSMRLPEGVQALRELLDGSIGDLALIPKPAQADPQRSTRIARARGMLEAERARLA